MDRIAKSLLVILLILGILLAIECFIPVGSFAETLYVNVSELNGRAKPSKNSSIEAIFDRGMDLYAIELNSNGWVEVKGGETGTVWCKAKYLSNYLGTRKWKNISGGSVNMRENPCANSKRVGKIKDGRTMRISAEVFGWGYIKDQGWVDLSYFEMVEE